jgi:uncharacterized protein YfdQ (DUF2303 family)
MEHKTEADAIAGLAARANGGHVVKAGDGREFLLTPMGFSSTEVSDPYGLKLALPRYIKQAVTLQTTESLVDYVNRFKGADTILFANIDANSIVAHLDYHGTTKAAHVAHVATMALPYSEEWSLWKGISGRLSPQLEFARFVEENAADIRAPAAGELLDAVRDLQAHRKVNFTKAVRTASDNENFEFTTETEAKTKGGIELPTKFKLGLPVYFGEPETEVFAFLRWKIDPEGGGLALGIQLHRLEHVRQAVFKGIVAAIAEATGCPVVFGKA